MNDAEWNRIIQNVLNGVAPADDNLQGLIARRLEDDGITPVLRKAALAGGKHEALTNVLTCLARTAASELRLKNYLPANRM